MSESRLQGALILQLADGYRFIGSETAVCVVSAHSLLEVPGLAPPALGLSLVSDRVVTVLSLGQFDQRDWVLCHIDGDWMGLSGARVVSFGLFPLSDRNTIRWNDRDTEMLDVRALHLSAEQAIWRARAARDESRHT